MGLEANCRITHKGKTRMADAHVDTNELQVRGKPVLRIPFASISSVRVEKGAVILDHPEGPTILELGSQSDMWADKIRTPRSRLDKLGVKPDLRVGTVGTLEPEFVQELEAIVGKISKLRKSLDLLFFAVDDRAQLDRLNELKGHLAADGALWVIRPKGVKSVTERDVMAAGKAAGLVDTKVVRFSDSHTAEKLVIPISAR